MDHIQPQSLGGSDELENLALASRRCNGRRYNFMEGTDRLTGKVERLFNPRQDAWNDHFAWSSDGLKIIQQSAKARATNDRLDLNDEHHDGGAVCQARRFWVQGGWHPPEGDHVLLD